MTPGKLYRFKGIAGGSWTAVWDVAAGVNYYMKIGEICFYLEDLHGSLLFLHGERKIIAFYPQKELWEEFSDVNGV
jgi:hypothetical protein